MNQNRPDNERTTRIVTLDFNGGSHVYRNPELGMNIPVRIAPSGISADRARMLAEALNRNCADSHVRFEVGAGSSETTSAVRVGRTADFDRYGAFLGLAEGIGEGDAYVLLDDSASNSELVDVIRHEAGHILGTLDHGGAGLARYAWKHEGNLFDRSTIDDDRVRDPIRYHMSSKRYTYIYNPISAPETVDRIELQAKENGTYIEEVYGYYYEYWDYANQIWVNHRPETEYIDETYEEVFIPQASGIQANLITITGGRADGCTAETIKIRGGLAGYDEYEYRPEDAESSTEWKRTNYNWQTGIASGCKVTGTMTVSGNALATECDAGDITVVGAREEIGWDQDKGSKYRTVNGRVENCRVGVLNVDLGGTARNIQLNAGYADVGNLNKTPEEEREYYDNAKLTNLYSDNYGGVYVSRGGEVQNVNINGTLHASEGAVLSGTIVCGRVDLKGFAPQTNILVRVDLHDYASANYIERIEDENGRLMKEINYYANYTTKIYTYIYNERNVPTIIKSYGAFDNKDGRFDMRDWKYTFSVDLGTMDALAMSQVVVDFGGTEKDFSGGYVSFDYPSTNREIQFWFTGNDERWHEVWEDSLGNDLGEYQGYIVYDPSIYSEAGDVLWLEYGDDEELEYTVALPAGIVGGATKNVTIDGSVGGEAELKNNKLVVNGNTQTGDITVKAMDSRNVEHECDLELIVVPEELPVIGKKGTKKYSEMLKKAQKNHITTISDQFPFNIHTKLFGMEFDLTNMGVTLTVDWKQCAMELKLQGKMEWKVTKAVAGTGRQVKLALDLSGDNYISVTHKNHELGWDLVGELKIPDFKIGKFEFSNMFLKVNKGKTAFSIGAYVKLPWIKHSFGGEFGIVDGYIDSIEIGADNLNIKLGKTGLLLQKVSLRGEGIASELNCTFKGTLGITAGPQVEVEYVDWLGIDDGVYSLLDITATGAFNTAGIFTGTAGITVLGGIATGGGEIKLDGEVVTIKGSFTMLNGSITINGELSSKMDPIYYGDYSGFGTGYVTIAGKATMKVPRERIFGPFAGIGISGQAIANLKGHSRKDSYVIVYEDMEVFGNKLAVGVKCSFDGSVSLIGSATELEKMRSAPNTLRSMAKGSGLRGATTPSASANYTVSDSGTTLFQVFFSVSGASASLSYGGVEYTQAAISAGQYENMQIVNGLTNDTCITIAVNNADTGVWTFNAYGDADADFGAYTLSGNTVPTPVITAVEMSEDARSATIRYTLGDLSALENATVSVFRTDGNATGYTGTGLIELEVSEATGVFEFAMSDEMNGGDYAFYLMVAGDNSAPIYSDISDAYTFRTLDTEAPDQIQIINSEWKSTGTVISWDAPWDDQGVAGYKVGYRVLEDKAVVEENEAEEGNGEEIIEEEIVWSEADVKTTSFVFNSVPNHTYAFRIAAYDAAGNLSAWSEEESVLVLTTANAAYTDGMANGLEEYESATNVAFSGTVAKNSLITGSTLENAEIFGIVENSVVIGEVAVSKGSLVSDLTVAEGGTLTIAGGWTYVNEGSNEFTDLMAGLQREDSVSTYANGITVSAGGTLVLKDGVEFSGLVLDYGSSLIISQDYDMTGNTIGKYILANDIVTAGTLTTYRYIDANGHKIRFEQYRQTAEFQNSADDIAFMPNYDKLIGDALEIEIDSIMYGRFKIADEAEYFNGTITVIDHTDGSSAAVGFDQFSLVGTALCKLVSYNSYSMYGLYLETAPSQIGAPVISVEDAENDYKDTISISATPAENAGTVKQYTFRYSLNANMSDAVVVTPEGNKAELTFNKDEFTANATYYIQASVENENGVQSLWGETQSFTVVPKLNRPDAPWIGIWHADNPYWNCFTISAVPGDNTGVAKQFSFRYSLNADMSDAVVVTTEEYAETFDLDKNDFTANATYYLQACTKNGEDIWGDWGNVASFTVVPVSGAPAAPTNLTVTEEEGSTDGLYHVTVDDDPDNYDIRNYRFRYANNREMENAVTVTSKSNYTDIDRKLLIDGQEYYFQAAVQIGTEWSSWTDTVSVTNILGWDYENITIGPEPDGDFNYFSLNGKSAKNVRVIDGGWCYGGGRIDGLTVEVGGFFRDDYATVTNATLNGGRYWVDSGTTTDLVVNSGELRLLDGTLNGATIGVDGTMDLSGYTPTITGTILIQGQFTVYYSNPSVTTDASFIFDLGAHETAKDKAFIDYPSPLQGTRTFTVKLDDTPEIGDYRMAYTPDSGEFYASLAAADGTNLGLMGIGMDAIVYNGLNYSLVDQKGVTYLHVAEDQTPAFIGKVKLSKNGVIYDSKNGYSNLTVSALSDCDYVLVEDGGQLFSVTVGNGGSVDVYGDVRGATIENGGKLTLKKNGQALSNIITVNAGGNVTIDGGKVDLGAAIHLAGGMLTVNGILQGWEEDSGDWAPTNHWFVFELDTLTAAPSGTMISDYSLLQCNPQFTATVSSNQAKGEYKLAGNAAGFTGSVSISYEGDNDWPQYLAVGTECEINGTRYALSLKNDVLTLTIGEDIPDIASEVPAQTQEWELPSDTDSYVVEYSTDNFEHVARLIVCGTALDSFAAPAGCQWRVRAEEDDEWTVVDEIAAVPEDDKPKFIKSNADGVDDVFFARASKVWGSNYQARHVGSLSGEQPWQGTDEHVNLSGKNRLGDIFEGSADANVLLLTDDANGDALFVDDIYTALPGSIDEQQARIAQINEIRAGAGNDIIDMTSQRFEYIGDGMTVRGGDGDDTIWANNGSNYLFGDAGNDRIVGAFGTDFIVGGAGNDSMHGGGGRDVFTFGGNWGNDTVEQLNDEYSRVMLWFAEGDHANWDASTLTYTDGTNSVTVKGVSSDQVEIYIGDEFPWDFEMMNELGVFADATSQKVFEDKNGGLLAAL